MKVKKILLLLITFSFLSLTSCVPKYTEGPWDPVYRSYYYFNSTDEHLKEIKNMTDEAKALNGLTNKSYFMVHLDYEKNYVEEMNSVICELGKNKYTEIENVSRRRMFFKPVENIYGLSSIYIGLSNLESNSDKTNMSFIRTEPDDRYVHSIETLYKKRYDEFVDYSTDEVNGVLKEYKYRHTNWKYKPDSDFLIDMIKSQKTNWHLVSIWNIYYTYEDETVDVGLIEFCYNLGVDYISDYQGEYFSNEGHSKMTQWVSDEVIEYENMWIDLIYKNLEIYDY